MSRAQVAPAGCFLERHLCRDNGAGSRRCRTSRSSIIFCRRPTFVALPTSGATCGCSIASRASSGASPQK